MLAKNPTDRITPEDALKHPYLINENGDSGDEFETESVKGDE